MPLIGNVDKYMAGGATVTALYAGDAKVWPLGPQADYRAGWTEQPNGALHLLIDGGGSTYPTTDGGQVTVAVPAWTAPLMHPEYRLGLAAPNGLAQMYWGYPSGQEVAVLLNSAAYGGAPVTNQIATAAFAGQVLRLTFAVGVHVTLIEVLP
jgi:hypothetical protein